VTDGSRDAVGHVNGGHHSIPHRPLPISLFRQYFVQTTDRQTDATLSHKRDRWCSRLMKTETETRKAMSYLSSESGPVSRVLRESSVRGGKDLWNKRIISCRTARHGGVMNVD